jgi:hypothetical protein
MFLPVNRRINIYQVVMKRIVVTVTILFVFFNVTTAQAVSLWELVQLLDVEHCFIPYYRCIPLGCG